MSSKRSRPQDRAIPARFYQQTVPLQQDGPEPPTAVPAPLAPETASHVERGWELRNRAEGSPEHDWFDAEHELQHRQQGRWE